jgi:hypothetical protein
VVAVSRCGQLWRLQTGQRGVRERCMCGATIYAAPASPLGSQTATEPQLDHAAATRPRALHHMLLLLLLLLRRPGSPTSNLMHLWGCWSGHTCSGAVGSGGGGACRGPALIASVLAPTTPV